MRTKALILSAMLGAAGIASSFAQNVYSVNVVGYINLDLQPGFTMIANQLDNGNGNLVTDLLANPPMGINFYKFNGADYDQLSFIGIWLGVDTMTLNPGEGAFVQVSDATTITFVGEVMQGDLVNPLISGYDIYSSMVPQTGLLQSDLGFTPGINDSVFQWNGVEYVQSSFIGIWFPGEPNVSVGESYWIQSQSGGNWTRTFNVQ